MVSYERDISQENCNAEKMHLVHIHVYGSTIVKEFKDHIRISSDDWEKIKQWLIPILKQGDREHATGNE